ncbi:MAG TPA: hypothetical protein DEG69_09990 [Flavobacteriaceae bacterium]|nr:hypothetical protein [Flavobacteriaceae bacterium]|tara:strand:+ start:68 stop:433 length:366 start_codon:yes stop_codon:yes gene_type:complete
MQNNLNYYSKEQFYSHYEDTFFNGKSQPNDGKTWRKEDLEMLRVCTSSGEGIRNMIKYFQREGKHIKAKQKEITKERLATLYKTHREYFYHPESELRTYMLDVTRQEIELLCKWLNVDVEI